MGLAGQNQVRHMYVGDAPSGVSTLATLKSAGVASDLIVLSADGSSVSAGEDFKLFQKDTLGNVVSSDTIKAANVISAKSIAYEAAENKAVTISALTVDVNSLYTVKIEISQHGSLSQEDTYLKQGYYKAVTGNTAEDIVDGLIASLNRNFSREVGATASENPYFDFSKTGSGASAALVVTGKTQGTNFDGDKFIKVVDSFSVDISCETYPTVEVTTPAKDGKGTGFQVVEMEHYLIGERGDYLRESHYPYNLPQVGQFADVSSNYNLIEIAYFDEGRDEAKKSKKGLTIAVPFTTLGANTKVNSVIADLNTILGAGTVDALPTS